MTAPDRIWAWAINYPGSKWHGKRTWEPFEPFWKKPIMTFVSTSKWNPFAGRMEVCEQEVTEYVRADLQQLIDKRKLAERLVPMYLVDRAKTAALCDEVLDPSGALLGYLRDAATKNG